MSLYPLDRAVFLARDVLRDVAEHLTEHLPRDEELLSRVADRLREAFTEVKQEIVGSLSRTDDIPD